VGAPTPGAVVAAIAKLVVAAPMAAAGAILGWIPYRLAGEVATRITRDEDILSTVKLIAGAVFLFVAWSAEAVAAAYRWGAAWAVPTFVGGVACGYVALWFDELRREAAEAWRDLSLRAFHGKTARRLTERRRALAAEVSRALNDAG
jgi:glycerol-3-phosphate O-acyltransferase/dihydroxyacetone phosphate acyltransferase